jgi:hypothetical protein
LIIVPSDSVPVKILKGIGEMSTICEDCGGNNIGWDAWVDENGEVIGGPYDNCLCMDCGCSSVIEEEDDA